MVCLLIVGHGAGLLDQAKKSDLIDLEALVSQLGLLDGPDYWAFTLDNSKGFTVKAIRQLITENTTSIDSMITSSLGIDHRWNTILPIKSNIFTWRLANGRLQTRVNLDYRGIDLHSIRCPSCNQDLETETHLFVGCHVAIVLWETIFKLWGLPSPMLTSLNNVFNISDLALLADAQRKFLNVVVRTKLWIIWRYRNDVIFKHKKPNRNTLGDDIKLLSFHWINSRSRNVDINWIEWTCNPSSSLSVFL